MIWCLAFFMTVMLAHTYICQSFRFTRHQDLIYNTPVGCTVYVHITHCLLEFLAKAQFVWCHVKDGLGLANFLNIQGDFWELTFSFVYCYDNINNFD